MFATDQAVLSPAEFTLAVLLLVAAVVAVLAVLVRPVPRGEGLVITRAGRGSRTRGQGVALVVPILDRVQRLPIGPVLVQPLVARERTADGLQVVVTASSVVSVVSLSQVTEIAAHLHSFAAEVTETALSEAIGGLDLAALIETDAPALRRATLQRVDAPLAASGLRADALSVESVEVTATADLLTWAEARTRGQHASHR